MNDKLYEALMRHIYDDTEPLVVPIGVNFIDKLLGGGMPSGVLGVIQAPTGLGKSTFLLRICLNLLNASKRVLYVSGGEQDEWELFQRLVAMDLAIDYPTLARSFKAPAYEKALIAHLKAWKGNLSIEICEDPYEGFIKVLDLYKDSVDVVLYDYIGSAMNGADKEYMQLGHLASDFQKWLVANNKVGWTAMQTNRALRGDLQRFDLDKTPLFDDQYTAASQMVIQKAGLALTYYKVESGAYAGNSFVDVFKNRYNGKRGRFTVRVEIGSMKMEDCTLVKTPSCAFDD